MSDGSLVLKMDFRRKEVAAKEKLPFSHFWNRDSSPLWYSGIYFLTNVTTSDLMRILSPFTTSLLRMPVVI